MAFFFGNIQHEIDLNELLIDLMEHSDGIDRLIPNINRRLALTDL